MNYERILMAACLIVTCGAQAGTIEQNGWRIELSDDGYITAIADSTGRLWPGGFAPPQVERAAASTTTQPWRGELTSRRSPSRAIAHQFERGIATFDYKLEDLPLQVRYELAAKPLAPDGLILAHTVTLKPSQPLTQDVLLELATGMVAGQAFIPRQDGQVAASLPAGSLTFPLDGEGAPVRKPDQHLAIPLVSTTSSTSRMTYIADPLFTTTFQSLNSHDGSAPGVMSMRCIYPCSRVPMTAPETRTFWTVLHSGGDEETMKAWYTTALADVPPGPAWLHEVAWQHYDYLSHGGRGWFEDIDAAEKLIPSGDRGKVIFTLHGWYGLVGRYTFDAARGKLDDEWTAFPSAPAMKEKGFPTSESVRMSKAEMHRRIKYARDRGFRVCLYYADGLGACEGAGLFAEEKVLAWGGWQGPDTAGKSYYQNPANPDVYTWYLEYMKALLAEYGDEVDALVWDETFMVQPGMHPQGKGAKSDYVCRAMMRLTRELTKLVTARRKDLAFLASDCIGNSNDKGEIWTLPPPYAIMTHGTYQDSHSDPIAWPYGIFPNYRNTLWSCNWQAVTRFDYTEFGVEHFDTPVATSNGWLDDRGIAGLTEDQRSAVIRLFNQREPHPQKLKWLTRPAPVFKKPAR